MKPTQEKTMDQIKGILGDMEARAGVIGQIVQVNNLGSRNWR